MVLLFCIFHHQVATAAGLNITTEYCHIVWLSYNCYRCHFPEGRNFLRFFAKSPHPNIPAQRSLLCFSYAHSVFLAQALLPFGKQNIKGVTWKNSNTVFVAQCDSNVVKRGKRGLEEC